MDNLEYILLQKMTSRGVAPQNKIEEGLPLPEHDVVKPIEISNPFPFDARRVHTFKTQHLDRSALIRLQVFGSSPEITKDDWRFAHGMDFIGENTTGGLVRAYRIYDGKAYLYCSLSGTYSIEKPRIDLITGNFLDKISAITNGELTIKDLPSEDPLTAMDKIVNICVRYIGRDALS